MFDLIIDNIVIKQEVVFVFYFDFVLVEFQLSNNLELMVKVKMVFIDREFDKFGCLRSIGCN